MDENSESCNDLDTERFDTERSQTENSSMGRTSSVRFEQLPLRLTNTCLGPSESGVGRSWSCGFFANTKATKYLLWHSCKLLTFSKRGSRKITEVASKAARALQTKEYHDLGPHPSFKTTGMKNL